MGPKPRPIEERFMNLVEMIPFHDCWEWMGVRNKVNGYGQFHRKIENSKPIKMKLVMAHRLSYEIHKGPIPEGLHIDHLCRNRGCVRPDHLEAVTPKVNAERTPRAMKTHCYRGHPLFGPNMRRSKKQNLRVCRTCAADNQRARNKAKRLARLSLVS